MLWDSSKALTGALINRLLATEAAPSSGVREGSGEEVMLWQGFDG